MNQITTLQKSDEVDYLFYTSIYDDLIKNGINSSELAKTHYRIHGKKEMRFPNKKTFYSSFPNFSADVYSLRYNLKDEISAIKHFLGGNKEIVESKKEIVESNSSKNRLKTTLMDIRQKLGSNKKLQMADVVVRVLKENNEEKVTIDYDKDNDLPTIEVVDLSQEITKLRESPVSLITEIIKLPTEVIKTPIEVIKTPTEIIKLPTEVTKVQEISSKLNFEEFIENLETNGIKNFQVKDKVVTNNLQVESNIVSKSIQVEKNITTFELQASSGIFKNLVVDNIEVTNNITKKFSEPSDLNSLTVKGYSELRGDLLVVGKFNTVSSATFHSTVSTDKLNIRSLRNNLNLNLYVNNKGEVNIGSFSDIRFSKNVSQLNDCLTRISELQASTWVDTDNKVSNGFIAQELLKTSFSDLVYETNGGYGVDIIKLVPFTVGAIQELNRNVYSSYDKVKNLASQLDHVYKQQSKTNETLENIPNLERKVSDLAIQIDDINQQLIRLTSKLATYENTLTDYILDKKRKFTFGL